MSVVSFRLEVVSRSFHCLDKSLSKFWEVLVNCTCNNIAQTSRICVCMYEYFVYFNRSDLNTPRVFTLYLIRNYDLCIIIIKMHNYCQIIIFLFPTAQCNWCIISISEYTAGRWTGTQRFSCFFSFLVKGGGGGGGGGRSKQLIT